ncbi:MAG: response regulator [Bacteroidales bacterium]|nr:response regulator [Bacteroidales bacterium]
MDKKPVKLIIVDDNELNLERLRLLLNDQDYDLTTINDGRQALKLASKEYFDLMLLDVIMPGMDGFEVCSKMKKNSKTAQIPVIFLTGQTDPNSIQKGFQAGAVDYVAKPFNKTELLARVKSHLELKQSREELEIAKQAAEDALKYKSEFLANMSHEIRTPINGIIGMSEFLENTKLDQKQAEYVRIVRSSANSLLNLINDILDFSKLEAGKIELEKLDFDLYEHIQDTVKSMIFKADEKGLQLNYVIASDVPRALSGDPTRLRQVLLNLISNALKFTEKGGVTVKTTLLEKRDKESIVKFEVIDTGIGINEEGMQRLFKSFSQVDASTTRNYGGTGLGLVISKSLSEMMGGRISVESRLNVGSNFWFTVKMGNSDIKQVERMSIVETETEDHSMKKLNILLAEDNLVNQKVASLHLEKLGHTVKLANNGISAFEAYKSGDFDLIFMDVQMPEADGYEATGLIRNHEKQNNIAQRIPIIAMTANAMKGDKEKCINAGMDDYISKPFTAKALKETLSKYA